MTYSKNIRKRAVAERVILSWVIVAILTAAISFCIGYMISNESVSAAEETDTVLIYGRAADGAITTGEISYAGTLEFEALDIPLDEDLQEFIFYLSAGYEIDWTFVLAIIQKESGYNPDAVSETGDYGLMQINSINSEYLETEIGVTDLADPYENIKGGMYIIRKLFEKYENASMVLMAYQMGETAAATLWEHGVYSTNYTKAVFEIMEELNNGV